MQIDLTISLIGRIHQKANRFLLRQLKLRGLGALVPSHGDILLALFQHRQLTMKHLAELIDRDKSTVTALVGKLVDLGFVQKRPDPVDSRIGLVSLTPVGAALKTDLMEITQRLYRKIYQDFSAGEQALLTNLLSKLNKNL